MNKNKKKKHQLSTDANFGKITTFDEDYPYWELSGRRFSAIIIFDYSMEGLRGSFFDSAAISNCSIEFLSTMTDSQNNPIFGTFPLEERPEVACEYESFQEIFMKSEQLIEQLLSASNEVEILNTNFQVPTTTTTNSSLSFFFFFFLIKCRLIPCQSLMHGSPAVNWPTT
jgi:hypothetical protein